MNRARALIRLPGGRRTKWAVLIFWLLVVAVAGPLAGKLTGAEKNDAQSWLPGRAESTQVLRLQSKFQSPNIYPAVVVYVRPSGLTAADRNKALGDAASFRAVKGAVSGQVAGPYFSPDRKAIETVVPVNLGSKGWNGATTAVGSLRAIARARSAARLTPPSPSAALTARCCSPRSAW